MASPTFSLPPPPAAVRSVDRHDQSTQIKNISLGLMRPLYTSCNGNHHSPQADKELKQLNRFLCLNELPRMPSPITSPTISPVRQPVHQQQKLPGFFRLPAELRLQIYALLVLPRKETDLLPSWEKVHSSTQDYFDYDSKRPDTNLPLSTNLANPMLLIRTLDPQRYHQRYPALRPEPRRSKYSVRCERFRSACKSTTYHCVNNPRIEHSMAIMRVSKRVHCEVAELFYGAYTFDFDSHVEAIVPFLSDLTPFARSSIKSIRLVKCALAYDKEFDRCEWSHALRYLTASSTALNLRKLSLGIVAGRPGTHGWDRVPKYSAEYFRDCHIDGEGMEWMQYLLELRGLRELEVKAVIEHCAPATNSSAMAKYVRFSASVEDGFATFLKGHLVEARA